MQSNTSVGPFWTIDLFVWTSIGVSKRVGNGVVEGAEARLCSFCLKCCSTVFTIRFFGLCLTFSHMSVLGWGGFVYNGRCVTSTARIMIQISSPYLSYFFHFREAICCGFILQQIPILCVQLRFSLNLK